jgi:nitrite reductase/ring-hydroxylating ferredoxin subunit
MPEADRRSFLAQASALMGLLLSYGLAAAYGVAYLFPPGRRRDSRRLFIARRDAFAPGSVKPYVDEKGRTLLIRSDPTDLSAFDTRCPHLGCKVHWESDKDRFFCPCHNGVFNRDGVAVSGPPADAGQALTRVSLDIDVAGNVFLKVGG